MNFMARSQGRHAARADAGSALGVSTAVASASAVAGKRRLESVCRSRLQLHVPWPFGWAVACWPSALPPSRRPAVLSSLVDAPDPTPVPVARRPEDGRGDWRCAQGHPGADGGEVPGLRRSGSSAASGARRAAGPGRRGRRGRGGCAHALRRGGRLKRAARAAPPASRRGWLCSILLYHQLPPWPAPRHAHSTRGAGQALLGRGAAAVRPDSALLFSSLPCTSHEKNVSPAFLPHLSAFATKTLSSLFWTAPL